LSLVEFNSLMSKELKIQNFDWEKYYLDNCEPMPGVDDLVKWTAEHYQVGLLSNNMPGFIHELRTRKMIPEVHYVSIVDSSKVGSIKPEARIYEVALQLAAVEPQEILLIDDTRSNLTAADQRGWHVLWFDDYRPQESIERVKQSLEF